MGVFFERRIFSMEIDNNEGWVSTLNKSFFIFFDLLKNIANLAILEARLAKKSIGYILLLLVFLLPLLMVFWGSVIFSFFMLLRFLSVSWQVSFFILSIFNMIILVGVIFALLNLKNNLFFSITRKQLNNFSGSERDPLC